MITRKACLVQPYRIHLLLKCRMRTVLRSQEFQSHLPSPQVVVHSVPQSQGPMKRVGHKVHSRWDRNLGTNTVQVSAVGIESTVIFNAISDTESPPITADVNNDGSVNILDLILIASDLGNTGTNLVADVNGDGVVSILDLILAAGMFEDAAAAPSVQPQVPETLTAVEVQGWLTDARSLEVKDAIMKRGFVVLEQLLMSLTPRETELLVNYPNPFNPETWIPYRLAEDAFVTLAIYDLSGQVCPYTQGWASDCCSLRESVKGDLLGWQKRIR